MQRLTPGGMTAVLVPIMMMTFVMGGAMSVGAQSNTDENDADIKLTLRNSSDRPILLLSAEAWRTLPGFTDAGSAQAGFPHGVWNIMGRNTSDKPIVAWEFGYDLYNVFDQRVASGLWTGRRGSGQLAPGDAQPFAIDLFAGRLSYTSGGIGQRWERAVVGVVRVKFADGSVWTAPNLKLPE